MNAHARSVVLALSIACLAPAVRGQDPDWYGVVQNDALDPAWARKAADLGVGSIKVRLKDTDVLEPGQPMYDFIAACRDEGLEVVVLFNNESVGTDYVWPDLGRSRDRAEEVVRAIGPMVSAWEVWNEPQSIEPERDMEAGTLMELLGTVYPTFAATGAPVLAAPEWTTGQADAFREEMASYWEANRDRFPEIDRPWPFDAMAVHAYFLDGWDPEALIDASLAHIAARFGRDVPIWVTEFGYPANDAIGYDGQREFIERIASAFARHGNVERMFYYSLRDYPGDESGANMGLFRMDGSPKPAAAAWGWHGGAAPGQEGFEIPIAELRDAFLAHLEATGAAGQVTAEKWDEWYAAYLAARGGSVAEDDFQARRRALRRRFAAAGSAAEKRAIHREFVELVREEPESDPAPAGTTYVVRPGDTLWAIATAHGLTLDELLAANPDLADPDLIHPGQVLEIPGGATAPAAPPAEPAPPSTGANPYHDEFARAAADEGLPAAWVTDPALIELVQRESSWDPEARNPASTAFGLGQMLHGTWFDFVPEAYTDSRAAYGTSDVYWQAVGMLRYVDRIYGTPERALAFWKATAFADASLAPADLVGKAETWIASGWAGY